MAYDPNVMAAAQTAYRRDIEAREQQHEGLVREVYRRLPRVEEIDRCLRASVGNLMLAAFDQDRDPGPAMEKLKNQNLALQRERAELLVGAGYAYDALDESFLCPVCQDRGYLQDGSPCRCLKRYYAREQNRRLSKLLDLGNQSFDTFSFEWYSDKPYEKLGRSPLENMEVIREICGNYAHKFGPRSGNLLFTGDPGLGKTFLSACIAREVSDNGFSVVYDTAAHVFQQFEREKFGRENPYDEDPDRETNRYLNCDLLILDDLGTEMTTSFVQAAFYRVVNDRLMNRKKTILSTNLDVDKGIRERYGDAIHSRLRGEYQILQFYGEDIRLQKNR